MLTVLILSSDVPVTLIRRLLPMGVLKVTFQVVCSTECKSLAAWNPALPRVSLLVDGLFVPLLVLLALEAFLLACRLV